MQISNFNFYQKLDHTSAFYTSINLAKNDIKKNTLPKIFTILFMYCALCLTPGGMVNASDMFKVAIISCEACGKQFQHNPNDDKTSFDQKVKTDTLARTIEKELNRLVRGKEKTYAEYWIHPILENNTTTQLMLVFRFHYISRSIVDFEKEMRRELREVKKKMKIIEKTR